MSENFVFIVSKIYKDADYPKNSYNHVYGVFTDENHAKELRNKLHENYDYDEEYDSRLVGIYCEKKKLNKYYKEGIHLP